MEAWKRLRPTSLAGVLGQDAAVKVLGKYIAEKNLPHAMCFSGPPGVGKTTLARILATELDCHESMLEEVNCAIREPMDTVRKIESATAYAPMAGKARVWILDEFQSMSRAKFSQQSLLKIMEDTGQYNYYFLCATDTAKILPAIRSRCTPIVLNSIGRLPLAELVWYAARECRLEIDKEVCELIVDRAEGSARTVLKLAEAVGTLDTKAEQLQALKKVEEDAPAIELCRALLDTGKGWHVVAKILTGLREEDPEGLRRMVLSYFSKVLLGGGKFSNLAFQALQIFRDNVFDSGFDGIVANCYWLKTSK